MGILEEVVLLVFIKEPHREYEGSTCLFKLNSDTIGKFKFDVTMESNRKGRITQFVACEYGKRWLFDIKLSKDCSLWKADFQKKYSSTDELHLLCICYQVQIHCYVDVLFPSCMSKRYLSSYWTNEECFCSTKWKSWHRTEAGQEGLRGSLKLPFPSFTSAVPNPRFTSSWIVVLSGLLGCSLCHDIAATGHRYCRPRSNLGRKVEAIPTV